jgi:hypothetical protein
MFPVDVAGEILIYHDANLHASAESLSQAKNTYPLLSLGPIVPREKLRMDVPRKFKFWAFISYSSRDEIVAKKVHRALETYRVPHALIGTLNQLGETIPDRIAPIFRDRDELGASSSLTEKLKEALTQSSALVVLCSSDSAKSAWVEREIEFFQSLNRQSRILCLIVERDKREVNDSIPEEPVFPPVLLQLGTSGRAGDKAHDSPLAGDSRPNKDGPRLALLKIIAGILAVDFDQLRRREDEREKRRRLVRFSLMLAATLLVVLAYLLAVDAGLAMPAGGYLRESIDRHHWSFFRPIYPMDQIVETASSIRRSLIEADLEHWHVSNQNFYGVDDRDPHSGIWASMQLAATVLHSPEATPSAVETSVQAIENAFDHSQLQTLDGKPLGWVDSEGALYPSVEPTAWACDAVAAALSRPNCLDPQRRKKFETWLATAQDAIASFEYKPGGYAPFSGAAPSFSGCNYSCVLVLGILLDCKEASLPWHGSHEELDRKIGETYDFLCSHFVAGKQPPGWNLLNGENWPPSPGLSLQVLAELLRAHRLLQLPMPQPIRDVVPWWLDTAKTDLIEQDSDYFEETFKTPDGHPAQSTRSLSFLHRPWEIALANEWRLLGQSLSIPQTQLDIADRVMSFQVVDRKESMIDNGAKQPFYYSSEYLWTTARLAIPGP